MTTPASYRLAFSLLWLAAAAMLSVGSGCRSGHQSDGTADYRLPDTLKVATLYSPTSYFIYREDTLGYDYSLLSQFAADKGITIDLTVATSLQNMIELLDSGMVDLLAYEIPVTAEYKAHITPCGPEYFTHQVLVQPRKGSHGVISDVTQLVGKEIYVEKNSKYYYRILNLNDELGGGIKVHTVDRDTLITEDLIDMVSSGKIPLTVVDSDIAKINQGYYSDLDISLPLSFDQRSAWGVRPSDSWLGDSIDSWLATEEPRQRQALLLKKYFERSKTDEATYILDLSKGRISPYDNIFRRAGKEAGLDWRLMAAQGYHESHFDSTKVSWAGARGIMQIMPRTARAYHLPANRVANPQANIEAAGRILRDLDKSLSRKVSDPQERLKFVIAAYNSGLAHIYDAINLAAKHGKNPQKWDGNVEAALLMKSNPEYYNDPVCRAGYFGGRQTTAYVRNVFELYRRIADKIPA